MGLSIHFYFTIQHDDSYDSDAKENWDNYDWKTRTGRDEGGEYVCASMTYSTFNGFYINEITDEQKKAYGLFDIIDDEDEDAPEIYYGDYVLHVWEWCKLCYFVNSKDKRIPLKMKFC